MKARVIIRGICSLIRDRFTYLLNFHRFITKHDLFHFDRNLDIDDFLYGNLFHDNPLDYYLLRLQLSSESSDICLKYIEAVKRTTSTGTSLMTT